MSDTRHHKLTAGYSTWDFHDYKNCRHSNRYLKTKAHRKMRRVVEKNEIKEALNDQ